MKSHVSDNQAAQCAKENLPELCGNESPCGGELRHESSVTHIQTETHIKLA